MPALWNLDCAEAQVRDQICLVDLQQPPEQVFEKGKALAPKNYRSFW